MLCHRFQSLILFYCLLPVHTPIHNGTLLAGMLFREASKTTSTAKIIWFENKWNGERCQLGIPGLCHSLIMYCLPFPSGLKRIVPCQLLFSLIQNYLILDQVQNNGSRRKYRIKGQTASEPRNCFSALELKIKCYWNTYRFIYILFSALHILMKNFGKL